ncbi:hypothetical protein F5141DRAFT_110036 [Pisolithus sp. B1]|nr:hypothetical protein F5141DRAFT_110036 [Pisolithus sp. B1]
MDKKTAHQGDTQIFVQWPGHVEIAATVLPRNVALAATVQSVTHRYDALRIFRTTFLQHSYAEVHQRASFLTANIFPADRLEWGPIFLRIMGSPDTGNDLQINGMGGGISSFKPLQDLRRRLSF